MSAVSKSENVEGTFVIALPPVRGLKGTFVLLPSRSSIFQTQKRAEVLRC